MILAYSKRPAPAAWPCTPEVKVLWHQKMFRMSSSFFQEPFRSSRPRIFIPKDLRDRRRLELNWAGWGGSRSHCAQPGERNRAISQFKCLTTHMGEKSSTQVKPCRLQGPAPNSAIPERKEGICGQKWPTLTGVLTCFVQISKIS